MTGDILALEAEPRLHSWMWGWKYDYILGPVSWFPGDTSRGNSVTMSNESSGLLGHFHMVQYKQRKWLGCDPLVLHLAGENRRRQRLSKPFKAKGERHIYKVNIKLLHKSFVTSILQNCFYTTVLPGSSHLRISLWFLLWSDFLPHNHKTQRWSIGWRAGQSQFGPQ